MAKQTKERNIYYQMRDELSLSREKASQLLEGIPPERLERIENEKSKPYPEEILIMAEKYKHPSLANYYCSHECPIGDRYVPEVKVQDLSKIVLQMLASLNHITKQQDRLIEITSNDEVSDDEIPDFVAIQESLERVSLTVEALQFWTEKKIAEHSMNGDLYFEIRKKMKEEN